MQTANSSYCDGYRTAQHWGSASGLPSSGLCSLREADLRGETSEADNELIRSVRAVLAVQS